MNRGLDLEPYSYVVAFLNIVIVVVNLLKFVEL